MKYFTFGHVRSIANKLNLICPHMLIITLFVLFMQTQSENISVWFCNWIKKIAALLTTNAWWREARTHAIKSKTCRTLAVLKNYAIAKVGSYQEVKEYFVKIHTYLMIDNCLENIYPLLLMVNLTWQVRCLPLNINIL